MPEDANVAVLCAHFEVAVLWCEPLIEHLGDFERPLVKQEPSRRLLATIARVGLDG